MRLFIDTNVFFDFVLKRPRFHQQAQKIFNLGNFTTVELATNPNNFPHAFFEKRKDVGEQQAKAYFRSLRKIITCVPFDDKIVDKALASNFPPDLEDGVNLQLAQAFFAHFIITRDRKGSFKQSTIPVYSPSEFMDAFPR